MKTGRVIALVVGVLLVLPGFGLLLGGGALAIAYTAARDNSGYVNATLDRLQSSSVAVTAENADFGSNGQGPDWLFDALDVNLRLRVTSTTGKPVFVGIGRAGAVDAYLAGTAHDEVADVSGGGTPTYRHRGGDLRIAPPVSQNFWTASVSGTGTQRLYWKARAGHWSAVLMNADGSPTVSADVEVGTKAGFVFPLAFTMLGVGLFLLAAGVVLIIVGATGRPGGAEPPAEPTSAGAAGAAAAPAQGRGSPVTLEATLDPGLSRWMWLVKWFLAIPHFIVLFFLWVAFFVLTVVAGFAILFTGRYPRGIFDFNVGVLRWSWRVSYYATDGGLGTDRYPPFSLAAQEGDSARLEIAYPQQLSRGLVLVKWWLLAIPQYIVVGLLVGGTAWWATYDNGAPVYGGLLSILVLIAAVVLLVTGRYPTSLFDLVIGLNRWVFRVVAYAALMTDQYPPFRLDQGGGETVPAVPPPGTPPSLPDARLPEAQPPAPVS